METDDRPKEAANAISTVEDWIKKGEFTKARKEMAASRKAGLDLPEWAALEARMARFEVLTK